MSFCMKGLLLYTQSAAGSCKSETIHTKEPRHLTLIVNEVTAQMHCIHRHSVASHTVNRDHASLLSCWRSCGNESHIHLVICTPKRSTLPALSRMKRNALTTSKDVINALGFPVETTPQDVSDVSCLFMHAVAVNDNSCVHLRKMSVFLFITHSKKSTWWQRTMISGALRGMESRQTAMFHHAVCCNFCGTLLEVATFTKQWWHVGLPDVPLRKLGWPDLCHYY